MVVIGGRWTQQGYSPFTTWTRGLAWIICGYPEELEFLRTIDDDPETAMALSGAALTSLISLMLLRAVSAHAGDAGPIWQVAILSVSAFFVPSAFAGVLSPLLTVIALHRTDAARRGAVLGLMFALGALGAIVGTLMAGLVMISWLGTAASVVSIALLYSALSLRFWTGRAAGISGLSLAIVSLGLAFPERSGLQTACTTESDYFCIRVDPVQFMGREAKVMAWLSS